MCLFRTLMTHMSKSNDNPKTLYLVPLKWWTCAEFLRTGDVSSIESSDIAICYYSRSTTRIPISCDTYVDIRIWIGRRPIPMIITSQISSAWYPYSFQPVESWESTKEQLIDPSIPGACWFPNRPLHWPPTILVPSRPLCCWWCSWTTGIAIRVTLTVKIYVV